jgi:hypothetical protein
MRACGLLSFSHQLQRFMQIALLFCGRSACSSLSVSLSRCPSGGRSQKPLTRDRLCLQYIIDRFCKRKWNYLKRTTFVLLFSLFEFLRKYSVFFS